MTAPKKARLTVTAVEVDCPACGDPVPDPDQASFYWTWEQIMEHEGETVACDCGATIQIHAPSRVAAERTQ